MGDSAQNRHLGNIGVGRERRFSKHDRNKAVALASQQATAQLCGGGADFAWAAARGINLFGAGAVRAVGGVGCAALGAAGRYDLCFDCGRHSGRARGANGGGAAAQFGRIETAFAPDGGIWAGGPCAHGFGCSFCRADAEHRARGVVFAAGARCGGIVAGRGHRL